MTQEPHFSPEDAVATSSDAEPGGAGATTEGAPAGFTADVGGAPGTESDPDEVRANDPAADYEHGSDLEREPDPEG